MHQIHHQTLVFGLVGKDPNDVKHHDDALGRLSLIRIYLRPCPDSFQVAPIDSTKLRKFVLTELYLLNLSIDVLQIYFVFKYAPDQ